MIGLVWLGWQDFSWDRGFIYSLNYLLLSFWYYFIHKFNWFSQNKIFCVFECLFCLSAVLAYVCVCLCVHVSVSVTYLYVCLCIPTVLFCAWYLFVQDSYMFVPRLVFIYVSMCVFVFKTFCECVFTNCQTIRALQQFQAVFKFSLKGENVPPDAFFKESEPF